MPTTDTAPAPPAPSAPDVAHSWPDPNAGSAPARFWCGMKSALTGVPFALRHQRVLLWCFVAFAVYVVVMGAVLWLAASYDSRFVDAVMWDRGPAWWQSALYEVTRALLYVVWWILSVLVSFTAALPLMAPLFAFLAEATEAAFYGSPSQELSAAVLAREMLSGVARSLVLVVVNVVAAGFIWALGTALGLIFPPLGTAVALLVGGGWTALWYGLMGMSYTFENSHTSLSKQLSVPQRILPLLLGYGTVAHGMSYIPPLVPFIVISATVLVCRLEVHGHAELSLRAAARAAGGASDATPDEHGPGASSDLP